MRISVVGLGLIGGSMAIDLRSGGFASEIIGVDTNENHCKDALVSKLVDRILPITLALEQTEVMILAMPVQYILEVLPKVLDKVKSQVIIDVGSTKYQTYQSVKDHPCRSNYVATHPMAGTEFSGPKAAVANLFRDKVAIFCDVDLSGPEPLKCASELYKCLGMPVIHMNSQDHDLHAAYVSHISHISSFALALTVLKKEKDAQNIFNLASGGFDSTVRLAKSSPEMWTPIFTQNAKNVINVLDTYIAKLKQFREAIETQDNQALHDIISEANKIRKILK